MLEDIFIQPSGINFSPKNEAEEIIQNVRTVCLTVKGSVPLDRDFGIPAQVLDLPGNTARAMLSAQMIEAVRMYEPRAETVRVTFRPGESYEVIPVVTVRLKDM